MGCKIRVSGPRTKGTYSSLHAGLKAAKSLSRAGGVHTLRVDCVPQAKLSSATGGSTLVARCERGYCVMSPVLGQIFRKRPRRKKR